MANGSQAAWQTLLAEALRGIGMENFAARTGIRLSTLYRWIGGDSTPRPANIQVILRELPVYHEQLEAAFFVAGLLPSQSQSSKNQKEIPSIFFQRILDALSNTPESLLYWTVMHLVLGQIRQHLDPDRSGLCIAVAQCMPPKEGKVRSLRETSRIREDGEIEPGAAYFLGTESLAGQCVEQFRTVSAQEFAFLSDESVLAVPILRHGKVGGSLHFISHRQDFFPALERKLAEQYTTLLSLGLTDFYDHNAISLASLPSRQEQQRIIKVSQTMPASSSTGNTGSWQALEQILLET